MYKANDAQQVKANFEWTEPTALDCKATDFKPADFVIDTEYQNRQEGNNARSKMTLTSDGFLANQTKVREIAEHYLINARQGVESHNAVPPITVAVLDDTQYFIGGHARAAGLMLAREMATDGGAKDLFSEDTESEDATDVSSMLSKLRIRRFNVSNKRDIDILAGLENSDTQHGDRLSPKERRAIITERLKVPEFAQYRDLAFAVKFVGDAKTRGTVQKIRKELWKAGETAYENGLLDINGTPTAPSRPGSASLDALDKISVRLENNYNGLADVPKEKRSDDTYKAFERDLKLWKKAMEKASRFIQKEVEHEGETITEEELLNRNLATIKDRIGYTEYMADREVVDNAKASTDAEASDEAKAVAEKLKREALEGIPKNEVPADADDNDDDDADKTTDDAPKDMPITLQLGELAYMAAEIQSRAIELGLDLEPEMGKVIEKLNKAVAEADANAEAEAAA